MSAREYAFTWSETSRPGVLNQSDESCHRTEAWKRRRTTACWKNVSHVLRGRHPVNLSKPSMERCRQHAHVFAHTRRLWQESRVPVEKPRRHWGSMQTPHRRTLTRSASTAFQLCVLSPCSSVSSTQCLSWTGFFKKKLGNDSIYKAPIISISRYNTLIFLVYFQQ